MTVAVLVALTVLVARRRRQRHVVEPPAARHLVDLAVLLRLALDAGMTLATAIAWVRPYVHPAVGAEAALAVRRARLEGLGTGLRSTAGPASGLFAQLAGAAETGAGLGGVLQAYQDKVEADERAAVAARLQRLPVKLVIPLALLMLPGLVLMMAGPALVEVFGRLR